MTNCFLVPIITDEGTFIAHYSENGLVALDFPGRAGRGSTSMSAPENVRKWHRKTEMAVLSVLRGKAPDELPPIDISFGTDFQQRVWKALLKIPFGQTRSYSEIAVAVGNSDSVRAVGGACGANRIPVLIPCHRVLAAGNKIGGFSAGLDWKIKLLQREGVLQPTLL